MNAYRFEQAKMVVKVLLEMLNNKQNSVGVIASSSSAWDKRGKDVSGNSTVIAQDNSSDARLRPLTPQYRQQLVDALDLLRPRGGSDHRFRVILDQCRIICLSSTSSFPFFVLVLIFSFFFFFFFISSSYSCSSRPVQQSSSSITTTMQTKSAIVSECMLLFRQAFSLAFHLLVSSKSPCCNHVIFHVSDWHYDDAHVRCSKGLCSYLVVFLGAVVIRYERAISVPIYTRSRSLRCT